MSGSPNQRRVLITDAVEWRRLYEQEARSLRQIAEQYDRPIVTVHRTLTHAGVTMRPRGKNLYRHPTAIPDAAIEEAVSLYKQGLSIAEVADALGLTKSSARYRLSLAGVIRSHSEALHLSTKIRRLPTEVEDEIIKRYLAGGTCISVSREVGVGHGSVSAVLARRGIQARRRKTLTQRRAQVPVPKPVDLERIGFVAAKPLAEMLLVAVRYAARNGLDDGESRDAICARAGVGPRQLLAWETGEIGRARFDVADRVLTCMEWLWWDVYDPEAHQPGVFAERQRDDVLAWLDAVDDAAAMWDGEAAFGVSPTRGKCAGISRSRNPMGRAA